MFKGKHYVPILRWKPAELEALRDLDHQDRTQILPLLEILPRNFQAPTKGLRKGVAPRPEDVFARMAREALTYWGNQPFYLDFQHLPNALRVREQHPIVFAAQEFQRVKANPIMVCHLADDTSARTALRTLLAQDSRGTCLRVQVAEVISPRFQDRLKAFLEDIRVDASSIDLMIDYQFLLANCPKFSDAISRIPQIRRWRLLVAASGAFPKDLAGLWPPDRYEIPRRDWTFWRDQILYDRLDRIPLFSDYTIQFGRYEEPPENSNPSASIRYTSGDVWVVMRGRGLRNKTGPKNEQYPAEAQLLCESNDFCGATFSAGDTYAYQKFLGIGGTGIPKTWLHAGINHHMTFVARQLGGADLKAVPEYRGDRPVDSIRPTLQR